MIAYFLKGNDFIRQIQGKSEGFTTDIVMTTCPPGAAQYVTPKGDTNCCEGDIVNKQCNGSTICSLSPKPPGGLQSCSEWMNKQWKERAARFCPNSMYNYYGPIQRVGSGRDEGCSSSGTTNDGSKPLDITQPRCKIYSTEAEEYSKVDSCLNRKALDEMRVSGHKSIIPTGGDNVALLISTGVPADGSSVVPTTCYDLNRAITFLEKNNVGLADMLKKDPCVLGQGVICGIQCRNPNEADLPKTVTPSHSKAIGKITVSHNFSFSFDFTPKGLPSSWACLFHFTTGNDCCDLGSRAPGIWFAPGTIQTFAIHVGHENDGDWAARPNCTEIQMNSKISFKLECRDTNIRVTIGRSVYNYTMGGKRYSGELMVFSGNRWHETANVIIENISYIRM